MHVPIIPARLYRYRSISSRGLSRILTHSEMYFCSPKDFNDPFDCSPPFSTTAYTKNELVCHYRKAFQETNPRLRESELEPLAKKAAATVIENNSFESSIARPFLRASMDENSRLRVLCLTEVPDDILMWSHYSDGHRGLALQFDKGHFDNAFDYCRKVDYKNNTIKLKDIGRLSPDEFAKLLLLKKSTRWKYEKEWRIIVDPGLDVANSSGIYRFPKEALTGIIFGCRMRPEHKDTVNSWLREGKHEAQVHQAVRDIGSYSIRIEPPLN